MQLNIFSNEQMSGLIPPRELAPIVTTLENHEPVDAYNRGMNLWFSTSIIARDVRVIQHCKEAEVIERLKRWIDRVYIEAADSTTHDNVAEIRKQLAKLEEEHV